MKNICVHLSFSFPPCNMHIFTSSDNNNNNNIDNNHYNHNNNYHHHDITRNNIKPRSAFVFILSMQCLSPNQMKPRKGRQKLPRNSVDQFQCLCLEKYDILLYLPWTPNPEGPRCGFLTNNCNIPQLFVKFLSIDGERPIFSLGSIEN